MAKVSGVKFEMDPDDKPAPEPEHEPRREPLAHVPPSQMSAQGPVPKPGEPLNPESGPNKSTLKKKV